MQEEMWEKVAQVARGSVHRYGWGLPLEDQLDAVSCVQLSIAEWYRKRRSRPCEEHTLNTTRKRARGECINRFKRGREILSLDEPVGEGVTLGGVLPDENNPDPEELVLRDETAAEILAQVENPLWLDVLVLIGNGYTCAEAADMLRIRVGTVKTRLHRCRAHLEMRLRVDL